MDHGGIVAIEWSLEHLCPFLTALHVRFEVAGTVIEARSMMTYLPCRSN
jgi:hypothetical protein